MARYLLDTNAYFEILKSIAEERITDKIQDIIRGECYISRLTKIEIISVIGKYARGQSRQVQTCDRIHEDTKNVCGKRFEIPERRKWNNTKLHDWLKLEKEISEGRNPVFNVNVLEVNEKTIKESQNFIKNALLYNFKSMDAMILGTAKAYSEMEDELAIVTADKGLKAALKRISYTYESLH